MKVPNGTDVHMIYGDQKAAQECYFAIVKEVKKVEEDFQEHCKTPKLQPDGAFEFFILDVKKPCQTMKIGKHLPISFRLQLAELLVEYRDILA